MVNKQYNIQNIKKSKNQSPPIRRNLAIISSVPNPNNSHSGGGNVNLDPISEEFCMGAGGNYNLCDRNFLQLNNDDQSSANTDEDNYEKLNDRNLNINDIGRFQYILQMDKEMECQQNRLYKLSPPQQLSFSPYSTTSSINSTHINNNHINFWKAGSQSPINLPPYENRREKFLKHLRHYWKFIKWPLVLVILAGIVAMLTYFLFIETKLTENLSSQNSLILNSLSNEHNDELNIITSYNPVIDEFSPTKPPHTDKISEINNASIALNDGTPKSFKTTFSNLSTISSSSSSSSSSSLLSTTSVTKANNSFSKGITSEQIPSTTQSIFNHKPVHRNTQILEISTQKLTVQESLSTDIDEPRLMFPTKETLEFFGFTSGHQNNFGIPIEEDERILRMLNEQIIKNEKNKKYQSANGATIITTTTDSNIYRTRVSPTLPLLQTTDATTSTMSSFGKFDQHLKISNTTLDDEICQSTALPLCRSILHYDLTMTKRRKDFTPIDLQHFEYLITSKCSLRSHEFICSVLEPECRPRRMGALLPCKRVCKSILEPCGHIIAASEILTLLFDCDSYPDSNDPTVCRDITRNKKCYKNEFQCQDLTCIPLQWKCDNIKDCAVAEDEENCKFCEQDEFRCTGTDKCIPEKWRCDHYEDCPDATDELDCFENDTIANGDTDDDDDDDDNVDDNDNIDDSSTTFSQYENHNLFSSIDNKNKQNIQYDLSSKHSYQTLSGVDDDRRFNIANLKKRPSYLTTEKIAEEYTTNTDAFDIISNNTTNKNLKLSKDELDDIQGAASGIIVPISKSLANFQDSKEIMMTSDSEADYKYSSSNMVTAKTSHSSPCPEGELRCVSGQCITISQLCDKVTDCPDGADEAMCVFKP